MFMKADAAETNRHEDDDGDDGGDSDGDKA